MATNTKDIRWEQRFSNYKKALAQLQKFIDKGDLSDLEEQGIIKAFEYTHELAWKTLKDFLEYQGRKEIFGSKKAIKLSFELGIIEDGDEWMNSILSRNQTSHIYNEVVADEIYEAIKDVYYDLFKKLEDKLEGLLSN